MAELRGISRWELVEHRVEGTVPVYGIRWYMADGRTGEMADVDTNREGVQRLLARLETEPPDEEQLRYIVADYLAAEYGIFQ